MVAQGCASQGWYNPAQKAVPHGCCHMVASEKAELGGLIVVELELSYTAFKLMNRDMVIG